MTNDYRTESYQQIMGLALAQASVETACKMMTELCNRGALDLCERDDQGLNVVERFGEHAPLGRRLIETIDLLGGRWAWSTPHEGRFIAMEQQEQWILRGINASKEHVSHRLSPREVNKIMAFMIAHVDERWLDITVDGGAAAVARFASVGRDCLDSVQACWARGVDIHARTVDGMLAVACTPSIVLMQDWIKQGGDVRLPVKTGGDLSMWQHAASHLQFSGSTDQAQPIHDMFKGLVDETALRNECLFLSAWHERANVATMMRHLTAIDHWHEARRPDGTPVWLAALQARPELLENLLTRKRARPDFTQRDAQGRSAWYAMMGAQYLDTLNLLENELPLSQYGHDTQGRGLAVQIIEGAGGLEAWAGRNSKAGTQWGVLLQWMHKNNSIASAPVLDGLETLELDEIQNMPTKNAQVVAAKLFSSQAVLARMEPKQVIEMGRYMLRSLISDENGNNVSGSQLQTICNNMEWAVAHHGRDFPEKMKQWMEGLKEWEIPGLDAAILQSAQKIRPMIEAILSQASLHEQVDHPRVQETPVRGFRF